MTEHYHALPLSPNWLLHQVAGSNSWLVSYGTTAKSQAYIVEPAGERVSYDNGAFSRWMKILKAIEKRIAAGETVPEAEIQEQLHAHVEWAGYYTWLEGRLDRPTSWAIVPDKIEASSQEQDALINEWPFPRHRSAPVWHLHRDVGRLFRLLEGGWNRVCIGSAGEFRDVLTPAWHQRMRYVFNELTKQFGTIAPPIHGLRMMDVVVGGHPYPLLSADSSNVGQNHNRLGPSEEPAEDEESPKVEAVREMLRRINSAQTPARWIMRPEPTSMFEEAA